LPASAETPHLPYSAPIDAYGDIRSYNVLVAEGRRVAAGLIAAA
jgi:hypothetical protein